jgi:hypothetical protein
VQYPKWVLKAINKIIRAFLWKGRKDIKGGDYLVGWQRVCRPTDLGGLGILNLEVLSWALQMRWMWLQKTQPDRPWSNLDIQVHANIFALFIISVTSLVGNGRSTCFWADCCLHGQKNQDLASALFASVPKQIAKKRTVQEALEDLTWVCDIRGSLQAHALLEFLILRDILQEFHLTPGVADLHRWTPSNSGAYSSKLAYDRFFLGAVQFEPYKRIWETWAPPRCKFFMWLASLNRCWTADWLARRGLDHPIHCMLCEQEEETIQHILVSCVFSREVWFRVLSLVGLQRCTPEPGDENFQ